MKYTALCIAPFVFLVDKNKGIINFGFNHADISSEYKAKPDYLTDALFVAERKDAPSFRYF